MLVFVVVDFASLLLAASLLWAWRMAAGSSQQVNSGDDDLAWLERVLPAAAYAMYIHDDVP